MTGVALIRPAIACRERCEAAVPPSTEAILYHLQGSVRARGRGPRGCHGLASRSTVLWASTQV